VRPYRNTILTWTAFISIPDPIRLYRRASAQSIAHNQSGATRETWVSLAYWIMQLSETIDPEMDEGRILKMRYHPRSHSLVILVARPVPDQLLPNQQRELLGAWSKKEVLGAMQDFLLAPTGRPITCHHQSRFGKPLKVNKRREVAFFRPQHPVINNWWSITKGP